jgi:Holliday junction DNA helicase RuvB
MVISSGYRLDDIYAPRSLDEYVGQERTKQLVTIMVTAAKNENRSVPNILISGPYGTGKTTLAVLIRKLAETKVDIIDAMAVNRDPDIAGSLIVDEIHDLDPKIADSLHIGMDQGYLNIIGCTTTPGKMPAAFRSRFRHLMLTNYSESDLSRISDLVCFRKGVAPIGDVSEYVAKRSRFNARQLVNYLATMFDVSAVKGDEILDEEIAKEAFELLGVDDNGYTERDRSYLSSMPSRAVGLSFLSAVLGIDSKTIQDEIEPYLLQTGVIDRTPRGRIKLREI